MVLSMGAGMTIWMRYRHLLRRRAEYATSHEE
jgi:hypothetical protein